MQDTAVSICEDVSFSALRYAGFGWPIIPLHSIDHKGNCTCGKKDCSSPSKHPKTKNGLKDATTDVEQIKKWWPKDSDLPSNIGIVTGGESGLVVVDVDGDEGFEALGEERVKDLQNESVPCVTTGRGFHYYFKSKTPIKTKPGFANKVDIKADGGYVVAPPSLHSSGKRYEWLTEPNGELPDVPSWVFEDRQSEKKPAVKTASNTIPEGHRNDALFRLACSLRAKDVSYDAASIALKVENQKRCEPPLPDGEVGSLLDSAYRYEPASTEDSFNCTDLGNAKRLVVKHGDKIRYCYNHKKWFTWNGKVWQADDSGQILRLAKDTVKQIYQEAARIQDSEQRRALGRWAISSESEHRLKAMVSLAESEPGMSISPNQLDTNHYLLNCLNGTVDLKTGELKTHDPQNYMTKIVPVEYKPEADCPRWIEFLETIFNWNYDIIPYVQRAVGYSLTGDISEQCLFILHGQGENGKSSFIDAVSSMFGDYAQGAAFETFICQKNNNVRNDLARMPGIRFISAVETSGERRFDEALLKQSTGGDLITTRFLYGEFFEFRPQFKLWLACNHKPQIRGNDHAIWRRIHLIPFNHRIPQAKRIPKSEVMEMFRREFSGILNWAIQGCLGWRKNGLQMPDDVKAATNGYRSEMDVVGAFITDCCVTIPGAKVQAGRLYEAYRKWCESSGETTLTQRKFGDRLTEKGFDRVESSGHWRLGVGLRE